MEEIFYQKCEYDKLLVDGNYQSSFFFSLIDEIKKAIKDRSYLVSTLALLCGIEQAGREVLRFVESKNRYNNTDCFNYFLEKYMGYGPLLRAQPRLYDTFRNGMAHEGFIKAEGECMFGAGYSERLLKKLNIQKDELRGLHLTTEFTVLTTDLLLSEFLDGIIKFHQDEIKNKWMY
jgi:hypothetical protein